MQKSKTETLIQKYLSHQLNEQEFKELKQWIEEDASHKEIFVKLLSLRHVNNQLNLLQQFDKEASWEAIQKRCKQPHSIRVSIRQTTGIKLLYTTIATVTMNLIVSAAIVLLNPYVTVYISYKIPPFALSVHIPDVSTSIYVEVDSKVLLGLPFCDKAFVR